MPLSTRHTKLVLRIGVLVLAALTLALAVRVVLENNELTKLLPATPMRTLLLIIAPLTSLAILHFSLAVRSFNVHSLGIETVYLIGEGTLFFSVLSPHLIGRWKSMAVQDCGRWILSCSDDLIWLPIWWLQPAGFAISIVLIVAATVYALGRK